MNVHTDYLNTQVTNTQEAGPNCQCAWLQFSSRDGHTAWRLVRKPDEICQSSHWLTNPNPVMSTVENPEVGSYGLSGFPDLDSIAPCKCGRTNVHEATEDCD